MRRTRFWAATLSLLALMLAPACSSSDGTPASDTTRDVPVGLDGALDRGPDDTSPDDQPLTDTRADALDAVADDASGARCRNYATKYTDNNGKVTNCSFDSTQLRLTCQTGTTKTFYDYSSLLDFVREAEAVGRITYTKVSNTLSTSTVYSYTYDAQGRLTGFDHVNNANFYQHYGLWDTLGRPIAGTGSSASDCTGYGLKLSYDDAQRTKLLEYVSPSCSSAYTFYNVRTTYDADGNQIGLQTLSLSDGTVVRTDTFTINSTAQVCI